MRAGVLHLWAFANDQDPGPHAAALDARERAVAARFATDALCRAYTVQHAMTRALLARYVACPPEEIAIAIRPRGKPYLPGSPIEFNLSHAADLALLVVAHGAAVGVDLERLDAGLDVTALAPRVLAPDERDRGRSARRFLEVWCRKEACLKATGVGLLDDLPAISVVGERVILGGAAVYVHDVRVSGDHVAAIAATTKHTSVRGAERDRFSP